MKHILLAGLALLLVACSPCSGNPRWDSDNPDLYCYDASNVSSSRMWTVGSQSADAARVAARQEAQRIAAEKQACHDAGFSETANFDIIENYNLSCAQIAYINDHLIDNYEARDGGYVKSYYRGFFSRSSSETQLITYVNERVLATGELVELVTYHTDCNNVTAIKTHTAWNSCDGKVLTELKGNWCVSGDAYQVEEVDYYTVQDFVMYYVDQCISSDKLSTNEGTK